jgi:hypothetical protein
LGTTEEPPRFNARMSGRVRDLVALRYLARGKPTLQQALSVPQVFVAERTIVLTDAHASLTKPLPDRLNVNPMLPRDLDLGQAIGVVRNQRQQHRWVARRATPVPSLAITRAMTTRTAVSSSASRSSSLLATFDVVPRDFLHPQHLGVLLDQFQKPLLSRGGRQHQELKQPPDVWITSSRRTFSPSTLTTPLSA